ncbi:calmodulin [Eurytemora carolleeae]|uniref:calmodulin n=1 Tax=Eurytemora carolleeae TaxID=1294199 RepID=UPI000C78B6CC|nr:calmodulin [Eurytemora carolleeae]|eukprot:XP_023336313.1 calmodulin-like [Eurytemora affinis]
MSTDYLSAIQIGQFQDAFVRYDLDADGVVSSKEVGQIMRAIGQNPSEAEIQDMVNLVDKDGTGNIDFPEFLSMMAIKVICTMQTVQHCTTLYVHHCTLYSKDGNGYINRNELSLVMMNLG